VVLQRIRRRRLLGDFGKIARMPTDGLPYALFYLSALVAWNTFATSLSQCALSMETNASLISKVYFPVSWRRGNCLQLDPRFRHRWILLNIVRRVGVLALATGRAHTAPAVDSATTALGIGSALAA